MKRAIHIGLAGKTPGWEKILSQTGVSWDCWNPGFQTSVKKYSCVIADRILDLPEREELHHFLENGGMVIDTTGQMVSVSPVNKRLRTIKPGADEPFFSHIEEIPVHQRCGIHPASMLLKGTVWFAPLPGKNLVYIGLPVDELTNMQSSVHKQFKSSSNPAVAERTAIRPAHPYMETILTVLRRLHERAGIPFVHKWWMPDDSRQLATFRIDSDYGSKEAVKSIAELASSNNIPLTWFLHVSAHEGWLGLFKNFSNDEIAVHCYKHAEFSSTEQYLADMRMAVNILNDEGFNPEGYAAPYGTWNTELARALCACSFSYSSEFCCDYDSLPSVQPQSMTLQLPVHPISAGSFRRFQFTPEMIWNYYKELIYLKRLQHQPIHLYHHPNDGHPGLLKEIFRPLDSDDTQVVTYSQWARWWKDRTSENIKTEFDTDTQTLYLHSSPKIPLAVHTGENKFCLTTRKKIDMEEMSFTSYIKPQLPALADKRRNGQNISLLRMKKDQFMTGLWRNKA